MKLLITSDTFLPKKDGVSIFLSMLIPALQKKGIDVRLVVPSLGVTRFDNIARKIRVFKHIKGADYFAPHFGYLAIKKEMQDADLVFNQSVASLGMSCLMVGKLLKKKVISYVHLFGWEVARYNFGILSKPFSFIAKLIERKFYNMSYKLVVPFKGGVEKLRQIGINKPIEVIPLGIDLNKFYPPESRTKAKEKIGLPNKLTIGYCGRVSNEKDPLTLLKAFRLLREKIDCNLILVGPMLKKFKKYFEGKPRYDLYLRR